MADPDLQITRAPDIQTLGWGEGGLKKIYFSTLRASVWSRNKGGGGVGPPGAPPWIRHLPDVFNWTENLIIDSHLFIAFLSFFNLLRSYCHLENFWRCIIVIFHHPDFIYILRIDWRLPWKSSRQELTLSLSWESFWQQDFPFFFVRDKKPEGWLNSNKCTIITYPTQ